jgi:hypothetical protein
MARSGEYASFFTYSVQRPYPLRWFTPVAIVGGLLFTVLISFANFVASGYDLTSVYASDPNTVNQDLWFKHWPAWLTNNINATCEPANLPVNSQFFTNKTGLSHTLTSITTTENGVSSKSPSLPYLNNILDDCRIFNITMDFDCSPVQNPTQLGQSLCNVDTRAYSTCTIDGPNGHAVFNISSVYNPFQPSFVPGSSSLLATNITSQASLWWAQQLLTTYWYDTDVTTYELIGNGSTEYNSNKEIMQGAANFYRSPSQDDITQLDFFDVWFNFNAHSADGTFYWGRGSVKPFVEEPDVAGTFGPPVWEQADNLAKSVYSAIMTDFGQTQLPRSSNIVASTKALQTFSERFPTLRNQPWIVGTPTVYVSLLHFAQYLGR